MKIIVAFGGLGNAMFYYALSNVFRQKGVRSFVFVSKTNSERSSDEIKRIFPNLAMMGNLNCCQRSYYSMLQKIRDLHYKKYRFPHKYLFCPFKGVYSDEEPVKFIPSLFENLGKNEFLMGHFQSYRYFDEYRDVILNDFQFSTEAMSARTKQIASEMRLCNSVAIHVRRGDYLNGFYYETLGKVCNLDYYRRAIAEIKKRVDTPQFYVFSDDPQYVSDNLKIGNASYIDFNNQYENTWQDMYLMSQCKHNIIANSTFSWWGAWLNTNKEKVVIAPSRWFANIEEDEIVLPEWIRL